MYFIFFPVFLAELRGTFLQLNWRSAIKTVLHEHYIEQGRRRSYRPAKKESKTQSCLLIVVQDETQSVPNHSRFFRRIIYVQQLSEVRITFSFVCDNKTTADRPLGTMTVSNVMAIIIR